MSYRTKTPCGKSSETIAKHTEVRLMRAVVVVRASALLELYHSRHGLSGPAQSTDAAQNDGEARIIETTDQRLGATTDRSARCKQPDTYEKLGDRARPIMIVYSLVGGANDSLSVLRVYHTVQNWTDSSVPTPAQEVEA